MKTLKVIGLIMMLGAAAYAALPDTITDPAQRDAIEYLDSKANNPTISPVEVDATCTGVGSCTATCATNYKVTGGGCQVNGSVYMAQNSPTGSLTAWYCEQSGTVSMKAFAICVLSK